MAKATKVYKITCTRDRGVPNSKIGTLEQLVSMYSYRLECGASYEHEKGNSKINQSPKTIKSLVSNLNNAVCNCAANGIPSKYYTFVEVVSEELVQFWKAQEALAEVAYRN